jgi:hypothetical protein
MVKGVPFAVGESPAGGCRIHAERPTDVSAARASLVQPQPTPPAWSAALRPSQRRAAERRAAAEHRQAVRRWLRDLTGR